VLPAICDWSNNVHSLKRSLVLLVVIITFGSVNAASRQVDLDSWMSRDLMPYVSEQLTTQPRFRNELLRFVVMTDENPQSASNKLALALRDRLRNSLADVPGIRIAWQPEQSTFGTARGSIDCTKDDVHYYIGIELTEDRSGSLSIEVHALDVEDRTWVAGFSRSWQGPLSTPQRRLLRQPETDLTFRGQRGAPYDDSQADLLAAHLAHDLGCALLRQTAGEYIVSAASAEAGVEPVIGTPGMIELISNNLADYRAVQNSTIAENANAVLQGKAHQIDDDLFQYWITITPIDASSDMPTLSSSAYIRIPERYSAAMLESEVRISMAKNDSGFLDTLQIVELRNVRSCASTNSRYQSSREMSERYSFAGDDCYALEVGSTADAVVFFLNHQLNHGLVRLADESCSQRTSAKIARTNKQIRFPLPLESLPSSSWAVADSWQLQPDKDTYYVVAATDTKAARALAQHIERLPKRCTASVRGGLEGADLQRWLEGLAVVTEHWQGSIDWRSIRIKSIY